MTQTVAGTFAVGFNGANDGDQQSGALVIHSQNSGNMLISSSGDLDANNKFRVQKSTDNGVTWANILTINSIVTNQVQAVNAGEQWRCSLQNMQQRKAIGYKLTLEN
jgi:hypothetical protein